MKRGIFEQDPSLDEDLKWRRSGNEPVNAARRTRKTCTFTGFLICKFADHVDI